MRQQKLLFKKKPKAKNWNIEGRRWTRVRVYLPLDDRMRLTYWCTTHTACIGSKQVDPAVEWILLVDPVLGLPCRLLSCALLQFSFYGVALAWLKGLQTLITNTEGVDVFAFEPPPPWSKLSETNETWNCSCLRFIPASKPAPGGEEESVDPVSKHNYENVAVTDGQVS